MAGLDAATRRLELDDGTSMTPDAVLIATGGLPRRLEAPGADLPGVFTLRSWSDCDAIIAATEGARRALVVGASFIAMETAASLRERGLEVTVVAPDQVPLAKQLGPEVGELLRTRHEEHGVRFASGAHGRPVRRRRPGPRGAVRRRQPARRRPRPASASASCRPPPSSSMPL